MEWRVMLSNYKTRVNRQNIDDHLEVCLDEIAKHGKSLASGPIRELVVNCENYRE